MKTIGFIGCTSRDKTFLMMYLGKILSTESRVCLVTEDRWMTPVLTTYEYNSNFMMTGLRSEVGAVDYCLLDITETGEEGFDTSFYVSAIDRQSVEQNKVLFDAYESLDEKTTILLNLILDSKINEKYLCEKFGLTMKEQRIHGQYMNDNDLSVTIENGYNEQLDLKSMSKIYKKLLMTLLSQVTEVPIKEQKRWMRSAERSQ